MRITLSTGLGRLHFTDTVKVLDSMGVKVEVITGWIPNLLPAVFLDFIGRIFGKSNFSKSMKSRAPFINASQSCTSLFYPEAKCQILNFLATYGMFDPRLAKVRGWKAFGRAAPRYLSGDIFHLRSGSGCCGAIEAAKARGMKIVVDHSIAHPAAMASKMGDVFDHYDLNCPYHPADPFWEMVLADCDKADILLVNSDYVKSTFVNYGYDSSRIVVNYLGVRRDFLGVKSEFRSSNSGYFNFLFTGAFGLRKGADVILGAADLLQESGVNFCFHVAGSSREGKQLLYRYYPQLVDRFIFHGFVPQNSLKELFQLADLYVFPSYAEGSAKSVMEAMATGLPVICTKESGSPITNNFDGRLLDKINPTNLYDVIMECVTDYETARQYGIRASKLIQDEYSWADYGIRLEAMYSSMLMEEAIK